MKFSNIFAILALAAGAVQALPTADAGATLAVREPAGTKSITKSLKQVEKLLTTLESTITSGGDVSDLLGLVTTALSTLEGLI